MPITRNLNECLVRRSLVSQNDRQTRHAFAANDPNLYRSTTSSFDNHRSNAILDEIDQLNTPIGGFQLFRTLQHDGFELRCEQTKIPGCQPRKNVVLKVSLSRLRHEFPRP